MDDCAIDTRESGYKKVEVVPRGCKPVDPSICESGYIADSDDVSYPKNSLDQCCRCLEGTPCGYCKDSSNCTKREKRWYITKNAECFYEEPTPVAVVGPAPGPAPAPKKRGFFEKYWWMVLIIMFVVLVLLWYFFRRGKKKS